MKRILTLMIGIAVAGMAFAQTTAKVSGPAIAWEKPMHDFGDIQKGEKVEFVYKFTNTGNEPLVITNVLVTCGCTTPKFSRDPIMPGGKSELTIGFDSTNKSGKQDKVITIQSNAVNAEATQVRFTANVVEKKVVAQ